MMGARMGCCVFPIKKKDIFDRCNMAEYIKIINLCSFHGGGVFLISQHDLSFMLKRTIKKGLVYTLKSLRVLSFHVKLI